MKPIIRRINDYIDHRVERPIKVQYPRSITPEFLQNIKPADIDSDQWAEGCFWVINAVLSQTIEGRFKNNDSDYVAVCSLTLKMVLGNDYTLYVDALVNSGILVSDNEFSVKHHICMGYKLPTQLIQEPWAFTTIKGKFIVKSVKKHRRKKSQELKKVNKDLYHLTRWLIEDTLILDKTAALDFLNTLKGVMQRELEKRTLKPGSKNRVKSFLDLRIRIYKTSIERWKLTNGFTVDNSGGRLHTPLTSIPSIFRNFITTRGGEELISLDIKNSQPFHMVFLFQKRFWRKSKKAATMYGTDQELYNQLLHDEGYIMFQKQLLRVDNQAIRIFSFKNLVLTGKLYEFICSRLGGIYKSRKKVNPFGTRRLAKKQFLRMMYYDPRKINPDVHQFFSEFIKLFPAEGSIMSLLKKRSYRDFSIFLQKLEAKMILHQVCRVIFKENPDIPLYTIHDSIITTKQYADLVMDKIKTTYVEAIGMAPQIEKNTWSEVNALESVVKYVNGKLDESNIDTPGLQLNTSLEHASFDQDFYQSHVPDFLKYETLIPGVLTTKR
jgi:hypothetical protein